jgi:hypothetical protein
MGADSTGAHSSSPGTSRWNRSLTWFLDGVGPSGGQTQTSTSSPAHPDPSSSSGVARDSTAFSPRLAPWSPGWSLGMRTGRVGQKVPGVLRDSCLTSQTHPARARLFGPGDAAGVEHRGAVLGGYVNPAPCAVRRAHDTNGIPEYRIPCGDAACVRVGRRVEED